MAMEEGVATLAPVAALDAAALIERFKKVRRATEALCEPLAIEDYVVQSMPCVSPAKWHLAHTSWFYATLVLEQAVPGYEQPHPLYRYLFNSYYHGVGEPFLRAERGLLSRPGVDDIYEYRGSVDRHIVRFIEQNEIGDFASVIETGNNHEQQHQELMLTDIKHVFSRNPLAPVYRDRAPVLGGTPPAMGWKPFPAGLAMIGFEGGGFSYDNELQRHQVFLDAFEIADRLVTNREYMEFMDDGGYRESRLWLSDGWDAVNNLGWQAPLYWDQFDGRWWQFTLAGLREVDVDEPVCHVSHYEADAYARWRGVRLPSEEEWEIAARSVPVEGNFLELENFHPVPLIGAPDGGLKQMYGDVWEWTRSAYLPYPGFTPAPGLLTEYNGKFMSNQMVLRGGSCVTPVSHIRPSYRNFFQPDTRWQFSGIRLARSV